MGNVRIVKPGGGDSEISMARTKCTEITEYTLDGTYMHVPLDIAAWAAKAGSKTNYYAQLICILKSKDPTMDIDGMYQFVYYLLKFRKKYSDFERFGIDGSLASGASDYNYGINCYINSQKVDPETGGIRIHCSGNDIVWCAILESEA